MLVCMTEDCEMKGTYGIREGSGYLEDKGWAWTYEPPSTYVIDDREMEIYPIENKCWEAFGDVSLMGGSPIAIELEACPCTIDLYQEEKI